MSAETIAIRYAKAVFEIGVESGKLQALTRQFQQLGDAYQQSRDLRMVLENPLVPEAEREALLKELAKRVGGDKTVVNTLLLLLKRRRVSLLPAMARAMGRFADERAGIVRGSVISPKPLPKTYVDKLQTRLETLLSKKIVLEQKTDPDLIAGLVTRIGDIVIDGSLRTRLETLRTRLLAES